MNVFIVHAHHEPGSFNGALTRAAREVFAERGDEVRVSDLYAMGFDPVSDRRNFTTVADPDYLKQQKEEVHATEHDGFAPDIQAEMDKLFWCDLLIFQFPMWWFGLPAILKGWADRVLASGKIYGGGKWYDHGVFAGKRAMCSMTTGGGPVYFGPDGLGGDIETILFPINHGIFYFVGFSVLPAHISWAPARAGDDGRAAMLEEWRAKLRGIDAIEPIRYPTLDDYDEEFRLKKRSGAV